MAFGKRGNNTPDVGKKILGVEAEKREKEKAHVNTSEPRVPREGSFWTHQLDYTKRLSFLFALVAVFSVVIVAVVLALIWNMQFSRVAQQRLDRIGHETANYVAAAYDEADDTWDEDVLMRLDIASALYGSIGFRLYDGDGKVLFDNIAHVAELQDVASADNGTVADGASSPSTGADSDTGTIVDIDVTVEGRVVGTMVLVCFSDDALLTDNDIAFRKSSYVAIFIVAIIAALLAIVLGIIFARNLVKPIRRISKAAEAIKEGDFKARANLEGNDEIAQLGASFDTMADAIEKDRMLERRLTMDVAHELRTPLMAMQSTIEAMIDGVLPADEQRLLTVDTEVVRLGRLVEALLRLSRLENRSNPIKQERINVTQLVQDLVFAHEMLIEESELSISFEGDPQVYIMGDPDHIRQAVANLISNAVRYTPAGGSITVRVKKGDIMAQISVTDTGIGIAQEDLKHVFSRFWRADAGRTRETGGLGIGLAVVKECVDRHHGWTNVESVLGKGTTFTIYVPLISEEVRRKREKAAKQEARERASSANRERMANIFQNATARLRGERKYADEGDIVKPQDIAVKTAKQTEEEYARLVSQSAAKEVARMTGGDVPDVTVDGPSVGKPRDNEVEPQENEVQ